MSKPYQPQITPDSPAACAYCSWTGTQAQLKEHLAVWDDEANPIRPACPGVTMFIDPDPSKWSAIDRYAVLSRKNRLAGMTSRKADREAAIAVGYREPAEPMTEEVKEKLREHNERKRELRKRMQERMQASKKKPKKRAKRGSKK